MIGLRSGRSAAPEPDFCVSKGKNAGVLLGRLYAANKSEKDKDSGSRTCQRRKNKRNGSEVRKYLRSNLDFQKAHMIL